MSETFSVKAILSADDGSFRSVFNNATGVLSSFSNATSGLTGGLTGIMNTVKSGLGFGILQGIGQKAFGVVSDAVAGLTSNLGSAVSRYDTLQQFPKTMELMGFKTEDTAKASEKLVDAIDGLPTSLDGITASTQNIAMITGDLDGATDTAIALNNAFLMSGASTADAERGLQQYVQMMSAGKVDMQSWRTLLETMSPALTKVAKSFGYTGESAKNDLYAALQSGKISFSDFNKRLIEMNNGMDISGDHFEGFAALAKTSSTGIATSMQNVKTAVVKNFANMITELDTRLKESGESIAGYFDKVKGIINNTFKTFIDSSVFANLITSVQKTISAIEDSFNRLSQSSAMKVIHDNLDRLAQNIGVILPNVIRNLEPIIEAVAKVATGVFAAISDVIAKVTSSRAFMTFCSNIGKAIEKVGGVVEKIISQLDKYFVAILGAANEVIDAFGKAFDAITNSATATGTATKLYDNFQKVLGVAKDALIKVAGFLEKHHGWILKIIEHLPQIVALVLSVKGALLVLEKVKTFMTLIQQVKNFGTSIKNAVTNVGSFASSIVGHFKTGSDGAANQLSNLTGRADTAWMRIGTGASTAGQSITTGIGGAFNTLTSKIGGALGNITSKVGSVISSVASIAGPIAMVAGPVVAAIMGIVSAIQKWKEEQYKAGQAQAEFTEQQKEVIEKNTQLMESYDSLRESTKESIAGAEAEASYARALKDEYMSLLDANGQVIEGKEKQAEVIRTKLFEAAGIEIGRIDELRNEYSTLLDSNGNVISGYEDRAAEIRGELGDALGYEISTTEEVLGIHDKLLESIDNIIDKKRLEAEASILTDAYVESEKRKHELHNEELDLLDELQAEQAKYYQFLKEHGAEREEDLGNLSDKERGYFDEVKENLSSLEENLDKNARAQERCEQDKQIAMDATVAAANEDYAQLGILMSQYEGDLMSAQDAVTRYGASAKQTLQDYALSAQEEYEKVKTAHENGESWATDIVLEQSKARYDYAKEQLGLLESDTSLHYEAELRAAVEAHQKEYEEQEAYFEKKQASMKKDAEKGQQVSLESEQKKLDDAKAKWQEAEKALQDYLDNRGRTQKTSLEQENADNNVLLDQRNKDTDAKLGELTHIYPRNYKEANDAGLSEQKDGTDKATAEAKNTVDNVNTELSALAGVAEVATGNAKTAVMNNMQQTNVEATREAQATRNNINAATAMLPKDLANVFSTTKSGVVNETTDLKNKAVSNSQETARGMVEGYSNLGNGISGKAANAMSMTQQALIAGQTTLTFAVVGMVNALVSQFGTLTNSFYNVGVNAMTGLNNGLCARAGSVYSTASAIANNVANTINAALQIHSPSRVLAFSGRMIDEGIIKGMTDYEHRINQTAENIANGVSDSINRGFDSVATMPDLSAMNTVPFHIMNNSTFRKEEGINYNGAFTATIEVPVSLNGREISRITVDTDSEEQYYKKKRYGR